ncbi:helix-turn-helix domain-containing protein [Clostridioides difficile]|uniref:helix-turn-helix domain-containing protein n=1 Tax=Clostridioides difficile TaxID=1496 RepID=UPI0010345648|nr:helix-turn-helix transcriptional regulator [Clostridioides difficile]
MNRLRKLRDDMELSKKELGDILGISPESISQYENEELEMSLSILKKLSNFYNVSVDYILGLSNLKTYFIEKEEIYLHNKENCFYEFKLLSLIINKLKENNFQISKIQFNIYELKNSLNIQNEELLNCIIHNFLSKLLKAKYKTIVEIEDKIYHTDICLISRYSLKECPNILEIIITDTLSEHLKKYNFSIDITLSIDNLFNTKISQLFFHFKE